MQKTAIQLISKKSLVRIGPGVFYDVVEALPNGLPKGTVLGVDKEESGWYRIIGTNWWVSKFFARVL